MVNTCDNALKYLFTVAFDLLLLLNLSLCCAMRLEDVSDKTVYPICEDHYFSCPVCILIEGGLCGSISAMYRSIISSNVYFLLS